MILHDFYVISIIIFFIIQLAASRAFEASLPRVGYRVNELNPDDPDEQIGVLVGYSLRGGLPASSKTPVPP